MKRNAESNLQAVVATVKNHMVGIILIHNDLLASECKPEEQLSCKCSPDIRSNYKHKTLIQMTEGFLSISFYFYI